MDNFQEVVNGVLHLFQEETSTGKNGDGDPSSCLTSSCRLCNTVITSGGVEFSKAQATLLLQTLLVDLDDKKITGSVTLCWKCSMVPCTLVDLVRQAEDLRMSINGLRRIVGRDIILGSLRIPLGTYEGWVDVVKSVEDFYPSMATKRRRTCTVGVGTDEIFKEEDEEDFEMFAGKADDTERNEEEGFKESLEITDPADDPEGSLEKAGGEQDDNRILSVEESGELKRSCTEAEDPNPLEPKQRRKSGCVELVRRNEVEDAEDEVVKGDAVEIAAKSEPGIVDNDLLECEDYHRSHLLKNGRSENQKISCHSCGRSFVYLHGMQTHLKSCHKEDGHNCVACKLSFVLSRGLKCHLKNQDHTKRTKM